MKANKRIKYKDWVITVWPSQDGFEVETKYTGPLADVKTTTEVYAQGELKQAIKETKEQIDKAEEGLARSIKELEDFKE